MNELSLLDSQEIKNIHFIGIGGSSMNGLASILFNMGYNITGSDQNHSKVIDKLKGMGIKVYIGHSGDNVNNADVVVYTAAISKDNPELLRAKELGIPAIERSTLLGIITKMHPVSIAVSGTHGKTSTTSMISMILLEEGLDPSIHIGGELDAIGGGTRIGGNKYFVTEACEYVDTFLKLYPYIAVILNIEADHLDYFKDLNHVKNSFRKFASQVQDSGFVIACADDSNVVDILEGLQQTIITYGIKSENAMWRALDIEFDSNGRPSYKLVVNGKESGIVKLSVPGLHNVLNSLAAAAACNAVGCSMEAIMQGLLNYTGVHKRFEFKGTINGVTVIDDYAHHPSEIKATLKTARKCSNAKIWCIFQPHTYSRAKNLINEFALAFSDADAVIVSDIYAAREVDNGEIHSSTLAERIKDSCSETLYISDFEEITEYLRKNAKPGDMVITMGAGDICKVGELLLNSPACRSVNL